MSSTNAGESPPSDSQSPNTPSPPSPSPPSDSNSSPSPPSNSSPPSDSNSSPPSDSSPPPASSPPPPQNSSPPPPPNNNPPPSGNNNSPPPNDNNNNSPPPNGNNNNSPPPNGNNNNNSPPSNNNNNSPPSNNNNNNSPPSNNNNNNSPPSNNNNNNSPPSNNNNNNNVPPPRSNRPSPPSTHLLPPARNGSPPGSDSNVGSSLSNNKIIMIGAVVGAGLLLFVMIICIVACAKKKKKRKARDQMYFKNNSQGNQGGNYYNPGAHGNWNNVAPTDHVMNLPPPPGSAQVSSEMGWPIAPPPPPPPMMSSSEMSSASYSGPYQAPLPPPHPAMALGFNQSSFTYDDLATATSHFSQSNLLGQGGFGYVHKGVLANGKEIAVKSLKANSGQGEREFQAEVDIISRVHHRHLVSLVGYCIAGSQRMLVYEFVPNGTLEYHLHGKGRPTMDWPTRQKIALGSAKGFAYLHEDCHPRIIHRDIKAANILIDNNFEAKVADFGLAKLSSDTNTHVSTRIMGTFGYLAPEYASSGKLTEKSDVYSYGIMLLELVSGRRPVDMSSDDDTLVDWARPTLIQVAEGGSYLELVDPRLEDNYDPEEMLRMVACAGACIRHSARRRPKMSQVVRALEGAVSLDALNEGVKPGHSALIGSSTSSEYDIKKIIRKAGGTESQEYSSSEHGLTGEFVDLQESKPKL